MNMSNKITIRLIVIILIFLTGCQNTMPSTQAPTAPADTQVATQTLIPPATLPPTPSPMPSFTPVATLTPLPTPATSETNRSLSWTPLPPISEPITSGSIDKIRQLAIWGTGRPNSIQISNNGSILAVGTDIGAFLYNSQSMAQLTILQTPFAVQSMAFSFNNQVIAIGQINGTISVFSLNGYEKIAELSLSEWDLPAEFEASIDFSPINNDLISTIETPENIIYHRWESFSWQLLDTFSIPNGIASYTNLPVNFAGVIRENSLTLQSISNPEETAPIQLPEAIMTAFFEQFNLYDGDAVPSANGDFLLLNNGNATIHWYLTEDDITYTLEDYPLPPEDPCLSAPISCQNTSGTYSWECEDPPPQPAIEMIALTPDDIMVLISLNNGRTEFRRAYDGVVSWEINASFTQVVFSPSGETFFGLRPTGSIEKRSTLDGTLIDELDQHPGQLYDLAFSRDGSVLAAGFNDGWIRVFSTYDGKMLGILDGVATSLQFSPDGALIAAGLLDGTVRIFELAKGKYEDLNLHQDEITDLAFTSDGTQLLTSSQDCTVKRWDVTYAYQIQSVTPNREQPYRLTGIEWLNQEAQTWFAVGNTPEVSMSKQSGIERITLPSQHGFTDAALSPDDAWLAVVGAKTWLIAVEPDGTLDEIYVIPTENDLASKVCQFTPDSTILVSASSQYLNFWSVLAESPAGNIPVDHGDAKDWQPATLEISPNGHMIALGGTNGLITIFAIP